jgi:hypothetical protein
VLSVRETLHLIPEPEMLDIDTKNYADYKYCALKEARKHHKDAKIQFVALIASKPELTEPNKLTWSVVDRSGKTTKTCKQSGRLFESAFHANVMAVIGRRSKVLLSTSWSSFPTHLGLGTQPQIG